MEKEIKDIEEILDLAKEEIEKNDKNIHVWLDLEDLKSLRNLYDLYNKEKEKNKDLEEKLKISIAIITKGMYPEQNEGDNDFDNHFIRKDKIKENLQKYIISYNDIESNFETTAQQYDKLKELDIRIETLEELLGDESNVKD